MHDQKAWNLAISQFTALRSNLPTSISENLVSEYHEILKTLESATDEDLSSFRISDDQLEPKVASFRLGSARRPGSVSYTRDKFCDVDVFKRKIDALSRYLQTIESSVPSTPARNSRDYWQMSDAELEALASKYNIGGYAYHTGGIDRSIIIDQLRKRDLALRPENPPLQGHTINVGSMTGSVIQQATTHSQASVHFNAAEVGETVEKIKAALDDLPLASDARGELQADIQSIEPQLSSPHPKIPVVVECLRSMRTILEELTAHTGAILLVHELGRHIANLAH